MKKTDKFIQKDEASKLFESLIQENYCNNMLSLPSSAFNPACITECPRRLMYRSSESPRTNKLFYLNKINREHVLQKWSEYLCKCKSIKIIGKNLVAADCHYNISGQVDMVLNMDGKKYVVKIQPVCDSDYIKIKQDGGFKKDVVETIIYMWLTELPDGLLLYENKNTNEYMSFHIKPYKSIIDSIKSKCLNLLDNKIKGKLPDKPYKNQNSNECKICEFNKECWIGEKNG